MNWTSVLFLLGYCQNATQKGFRLYVQFEQINKGMFVKATFFYSENFTHRAKTTKKIIYLFYILYCNYFYEVFTNKFKLCIEKIKLRFYNRSN
jgi:hypothetical protein